MNTEMINTLYARLCRDTVNFQTALQGKVNRHEISVTLACVEANGFNQAMKAAIENLFSLANVTCAIEHGKRIK